MQSKSISKYIVNYEIMKRQLQCLGKYIILRVIDKYGILY